MTTTPIPCGNYWSEFNYLFRQCCYTHCKRGINYVWSTGAITSSIQANSNTSANYSVVVANGNCRDTASTSVTVNSSPFATTSGNVTIFQGQSTTLTSSGGTIYVWNIGETTTSVVASPIVTIVYCVIVSYTNNCKDTACATVAIESPCNRVGALLFPNAFSPNNDGENDKIYYGNLDCIESLRLIIYDRWGERVYETGRSYYKYALFFVKFSCIMSLAHLKALLIS